MARAGKILRGLHAPWCNMRASEPSAAKVYGHIKRWRNQAIEGGCAYVYLDGLALKRSWGGEIRNVSVLAALGMDAQGHRHVPGVVDGCKEDKVGGLGFPEHLRKRGLSGVRLIVSDVRVQDMRKQRPDHPDPSPTFV